MKLLRSAINLNHGLRRLMDEHGCIIYNQHNPPVIRDPNIPASAKAMAGDALSTLHSQLSTFNFQLSTFHFPIVSLIIGASRCAHIEYSGPEGCSPSSAR